MSIVAFDPDYGQSVDPGVRCHPDQVITLWNHAQTWDYDIALAAGGLPHFPKPNNGTRHEMVYDTTIITALSLQPVMCPNAWSTVATFVVSSVSTQVMCCPP